MKKFTIKAKLWLYPGETASWHFLTVPKDVSTKIKKLKPLTPRGWGSVRVQAKINKTVWDTSIFPDSKSGTYILPIKASVRRAEGIFTDDSVHFTLTLIS
jgi:hypothetical protein